MAGGLGLLAGLGQAALGLPKGLEVAQTEADKAAVLAQQQRQFDASRFADLPTESLPESYRTQAGTAPTMRIPVSNVPFASSLGAEERKNALESKRGAIMGNTLRAIGTPEAAALASLVEGGAGNNEKLMGAAEAVMKMKGEADRRTQGNAFMAALMSGDPAKVQAALAGTGASAPMPTAPAGPAPLGPPRFMPTGGMGTPDVSSIPATGAKLAAGVPDDDVTLRAASALVGGDPAIRAATSRVGDAAQRVAQVAGIPPASTPGAPAPAVAAAPGGFKLPPGMKLHYDPATGGVKVELGQEAHAQQGAEYVAAVNEVRALEDAGMPKTDPRYVRAALHMDRLKPMPLQQGGFISGPSGGPPLATGAVPPLPEAVVQDIRGLAGIRSAAEQVKASLADPAVQSYIGPYAQYKSKGQMMVPGPLTGITGQVPPAVIDMEQNLARIKNYTIKLITGAQMSQQEAQRIMQELPDQGTPPDVFARRLDNSMRAIQGMEQRTLQMALRGDQRAVLVATELGLMKPGQQGAAPAPAPAATPPAPTSPPGSRQVRVRDAMNPNRKGTVTLGPGEALPPNLIEDR